MLDEEQVVRAKDAGAVFGLAPGVMTPSDVEYALAFGCNLLKLFHAEVAGGTAMLKSLAGTYAHTGVKFIPTGGISSGLLESYLKLPVVAAIGGSWMVEKSLVNEGEWPEINRLTREALAAAAAAGHAFYTGSRFPEGYRDKVAFVCGPTGSWFRISILRKSAPGSPPRNRPTTSTIPRTHVVEKAVTALGRKFSFYRCDTTDRSAVRDFASKVLAKHGCCDSPSAEIGRIISKVWRDRDSKDPMLRISTIGLSSQSILKKWRKSGANPFGLLLSQA